MTPRVHPGKAKFQAASPLQASRLRCLCPGRIQILYHRNLSLCERANAFTAGCLSPSLAPWLTRSSHRFCKARGAPSLSSNVEVFTHLGDQGLPSGLLLEIAVTIVVAFTVRQLLTSLAEHAAKQMSEHKKEGVSIPKVLRSVIVAVQGPICFYLPIKAVLRVGVLLVVALDRQGRILATSDTPQWQVLVLERICEGILRLDKLANTSFSLILSILAMWAFLRLKDTVVKSILDEAATLEHPQQRVRDNLLLPFSTLATWAIFGTGTVIIMKILGWDVRPLMAAGGFSGIVLGLATQSVLANALAGLQLVIVRPLVVGERVSLSGSVNVTGVVEQLDFLQTVIRTDTHIPYTLPNKTLVNAVISNESRIQMSTVKSTYSHTRQLYFTIRLRYRDIDKTEDIVKSIKRFLARKCEGVEKSLPMTVALSNAFESQAITIKVRVNATPFAARRWSSWKQHVQVNATPFAARRWSSWKQQVLLGVHKILKEAKVSIAPSVVDMFHEDPDFAERMATLATG